MTKYILHGGAANLETDKTKEFFQETTKDLPGIIKFLCVYFARSEDPNDWDRIYDEDKKLIQKFVGNEIEFSMSSPNIEKFTKQVVDSDIIFLKGGFTQSLLDKLKLIPDLEKLFEGKVIAGSSAGALVLSTHYYDGDLDGYYDGLGILPVKLICHWDESRFDKLSGLNSYGDSKLEVLTIPEQDYIVIER